MIGKNMPFKKKKKKKKTENLVLKYPKIRSYVSTIRWSYKKKIVNRAILYTRHYGICLNDSRTVCSIIKL